MPTKSVAKKTAATKRTAPAEPKQPKKQPQPKAGKPAAPEIVGPSSAETRAMFGARGYQPRFFLDACLPYKDPGDVELWSRTNGTFSLSIQPHKVARTKRGKEQIVSYGIPYGSIPRLLGAYLGTEVQIKGSREIVLGDDLTDFMTRVGVVSKRGKGATNSRFKDQLLRLATARISYTEVRNGGQVTTFLQMAKEVHEYWREGGQGQLFESKIVLTEDAFEAFKSTNVPLNLNTLGVLKKSPLALDIYGWLTQRLYRLKTTQRIPYEALQTQFGGDYARPRKFIETFNRALRMVLKEYTAAVVEITPEAIILKPSQPHVPLTKTRVIDAIPAGKPLRKR